MHFMWKVATFVLSLLKSICRLTIAKWNCQFSKYVNTKWNKGNASTGRKWENVLYKILYHFFLWPSTFLGSSSLKVWMREGVKFENRLQERRERDHGRLRMGRLMLLALLATMDGWRAGQWVVTGRHQKNCGGQLQKLSRERFFWMLVKVNPEWLNLNIKFI